MSKMTAEDMRRRAEMIATGFMVCCRADCRHSGRRQQLIEFGRDSRATTGVGSVCKTCRAAMRKAPSGVAARQRYAATERGRAAIRERAERAKEIARANGKLQARWTVRNAIKLGHLKCAREFDCAICLVRPALDWHHHMGHDRAHWLDVIPVCRRCHLAADNNPQIVRQYRIPDVRDYAPRQRPATCKRGHSLEGAPVDKRGKRRCRECHRIRGAANRKRRHA